MPMPEIHGIPPEEPRKHRWGCAVGCGSLALATAIGGGLYLAHIVNGGNSSESNPAATASPFEHDTPTDTPTPEDTLSDNTSTVDPAETVSETPSATETESTEPAQDENQTPSDDQSTQSAPKSGADKYKECPWTEDSPQKVDANGEVQVWSSCGAPGLGAYKFPSITPVKIKDGTKVTPLCKWEDGSGYLGTKVNGERTFILATDLGFVSVKDSCQKPN